MACESCAAECRALLIFSSSSRAICNSQAWQAQKGSVTEMAEIDNRQLFLNVCREFHSFEVAPSEFEKLTPPRKEQAELRRATYRRLMCEEAGRSLNDLGGLLSNW